MQTANGGLACNTNGKKNRFGRLLEWYLELEGATAQNKFPTKR